MPIRGRSAWRSLAALLLTLAALPAAQAACPQSAARFASLEGEVQVRDGQQAWRPARLEARLCDGDTVRVGNRSRAALVLANEAVLRLDQNTTLRLTEVAASAAKSSIIELLKGAAHSFIRRPRTLTVNTPYLNGSIEGTEFQVRVADDGATLQVMEGQVRVDNSQGEVVAQAGTIAAARAGAAPLLSTVVRPLDAVQWTLYFPPLLTTSAAPAPFRAAVQRLRDGDADGAFAALDTVVESGRDGIWHGQRAALLLSLGRADEARQDLQAMAPGAPGHGFRLALESVLKVLGNQPADALQQARQALQLEDTAAARLALSYALQANFRLEEARDDLLRASEVHPGDALLRARRAELELMLGHVAAAQVAIEGALQLEPELARALMVRGFVQLAGRDPAEAGTDFEAAIRAEPADPLAHLGLGLARVAGGDLQEGRTELEVAVALDPSQALLRAYLGKAYFEERRDGLDRQQFDIARQLDPRDPTAYLYEGLRKRAANQPVAAVEDLQQSIARNDNRAVYRSRQLLDRDRATRGSSLASAYRDVGFLDTGLKVAADSLGDDAGDPAAHRFLSEVYGGVRRREVARVSELLQAQLLQDQQLTPLTPSAGEANLNLAAAGGPAGYNEFTSLFQRDRLQGVALLGGGNRDRLGGEVALSGVTGPVSFGLGVLDWRNDGWRPNNDLRQQVYTAFAQAALGEQINVQAEYRHRESDEGDLAFNVDPDRFVADKRNGRDIDSARVGLRITPSPDDHLLLSFIRSWRDESLVETRPLPPDPENPDAGVTTFSNRRLLDEAASQAEAQYLRRGTAGVLIAGMAWARGSGREDSAVSIDDSVLGNLFAFEGSDGLPSKDLRGYAYFNGGRAGGLQWTLGLAHERFELQGFDRTWLHPKFGLRWQASEAWSFRAAAFRSAKPALVANRSLEPTSVAGFNQLFDDLNGTRTTFFGLGSHGRLSRTTSIGAEVSRRDLDEPTLDFEGGWITEDRREWLARGYWTWAASERVAVTAAVVYDRYSAASGVVTMADGLPERVLTRSLPLSVQYFDPVGWSVGGSVIGVRQSVRRDPFSDQASGNDSFAVVNADVGYRLPRRYGTVSLAVKNLLDTRFRYQDDSYREFRDEPSVGPFFPRRMLVVRLVAGF